MFLMNLNEMVLPEANGGRQKAMAPVEAPTREMAALPKRGEHLREWREHSWAVLRQGCLSTNQKVWFPYPIDIMHSMHTMHKGGGKTGREVLSLFLVCYN